jgi:hypothetical protein
MFLFSILRYTQTGSTRFGYRPSTQLKKILAFLYSNYLLELVVVIWFNFFWMGGGRGRGGGFCTWHPGYLRVTDIQPMAGTKNVQRVLLKVVI